MGRRDGNSVGLFDGSSDGCELGEERVAAEGWREGIAEGGKVDRLEVGSDVGVLEAEGLELG